MFPPTIKDIWEKIGTPLYALQTKIVAIKQNNLPLIEYFNLVKGLWLELDQYQNLKMVCLKDTKTLATVNEETELLTSW